LTKFDKVAHAVQDALGNKLLFCYEECDDCNRMLARVEDNFRVLMDFRRSMYHIPRKGTTKSAKVVGKNFVIMPDATGNPELYIVEEAIPANIDRAQPFAMHLELKEQMVNEEMYKALCKIVIDMLPSKHLKHFKQTINWINPNIDWMPDSLPSILTHFIPTEEIIYPQPVLDIFISKQHFSNSPYCTAVLYIYDIIYMFILPMVDVDGGMFKYDETLDVHWQRMANLLNVGKWVRQDSSNYMYSTAWVNWIINPSQPNVHILPEKDSVFDECHIKKTLPTSVVFPPFKWDGIKEPTVVHASFKCHYYDDISSSDLSDITQHYSGLVFRIEPKSKQIFVKLSFESNDTTDRIKFFDVDFEVCIDVPSLNSYISYQTDENGFMTSFAIDNVFRKNIFRLSLLYADWELNPQRKETPFKKCRLDKLAMDDRLLLKAYYLVPTGGDYYIPIKDSQLHGVACY